jgi:hypothetical protein
MKVVEEVETASRAEAPAGRRWFVTRSLQVLVALGFIRAPQAKAEVRAPAAPEGARDPGDDASEELVAPERDPEHTPEPSFLDSLVGRSFRGCQVQRVSPAHLGGAAIVLASPEGPFQIDVLARGETPGVAETERYALFLANRGDGREPTEERHGLALMDVAVWLREHERRAAPLPVQTLAERLAAHPRGNFHLP